MLKYCMNENVNASIDIGGLLIKLAYVEYLHRGDHIYNKERVAAFLNNLNEISSSNSKNIELIYKEFKIYFYLIDKSLTSELVHLIHAYSDCIFTSINHKLVLTGTCSISLKNELKNCLEKNKFNSIDSVPLEFISSYYGIEILNCLNKKTENMWYTFEKNMCRKNVNNIENSYVLVNIGTSTSILYITNSDVEYLMHFNISGGTYFGLCKLFCGIQKFEEAIQASELGNNKSIDYTMNDLIQCNKENSKTTECESNTNELDIDFIINSFGKLNIEENNYNKNDIANAILLMVINSCSLNASYFAKKYNCKQILYAGSFLFNNNYAKFKIATLVSYLSKNSVEAVFSDKDAFLNAIGGLYNYHDINNKINFKSCM